MRASSPLRALPRVVQAQFQPTYSPRLKRHLIRLPASTHSPLTPSTFLRAFEDATPLGLANTTFSFPSSEHLAYFLTALGEARRAQLRHISVRGTPIGFFLKGPEDMSSYTTFSGPLCITGLFPGLQLETLTILDGFHGPNVDEDGWGHRAAYSEVEDQVLDGRGWRELRFFSRSDSMFRWEPFEAFHGPREVQPGSWDREMRRRDAGESGACVKMFRAVELAPYPTNWGPPMNPEPEDDKKETAASDASSPDANGSRPQQLVADDQETDSIKQADQDASKSPVADEMSVSSSDEEQPAPIRWENIDEALPWSDELFTEVSQSSPSVPLDGITQNADHHESLGDGFSFTGWSVDDEYMLGAEQRPHLVVVRRGKDVDVAVPENAWAGKWKMDELRELLDRYEWDWERIRKDGLLVSGYDCPCAHL